jgi:hypothetical protein
MNDNIKRYVKYFDEQVSKKSNGDFAMMQLVPDGYGGAAEELSTCFYTRRDYDDGSFIIEQRETGPFDKVIRFGPLESKLSELIRMGFILVIQGWKYHRNQKLRLVRGKEQYKLTKIRTVDLGKYDNLTNWVKDGTKPHFEPYTVEHVQPKTIIKEVRIETDPFEQLLLRYPVTRKPVEFIGNQTLTEYVKQQLREQRRLQNV